MTALGKMDGVKTVRVDYASGRAEIESKRPLDREQLQSALQNLGYELSNGSDELTRAASLLVIILGLTVILDRLGLLNRLVPQQLGTSGMSYGLFFVTGLLTSVHCVAMCGGINLSQSLPGRGKWSALLYNAGRVVSYTLVGALLGAAGYLLGGGSFAVSPLLQGAVKLLAGAFMLLAGINLLGLFPALRRLRLPLPKLHGSSRLPFVIGLLNGLMPCGPLQAMQLAALGTGNPLNGALSMLFFSLGTVPLMLGLGGLVALLGQRFARTVNLAGAVLVSVFGVAMLSQGAALSGMIDSFRLWAFCCLSHCWA
jgi:sulfite exporter TauE/SafE